MSEIHHINLQCSDNNTIIQNVNNSVLNLNSSKAYFDELKKWMVSRVNNKLKILILTTTQAELNQYLSEKEKQFVCFERYGATQAAWRDWKPFCDHTRIMDLLEEYCAESKRELSIFVCEDLEKVDSVHLNKIKHNITPELILIADGIALSLPKNKNLINIFNHKDIKGCLITNCQELNASCRHYIQRNVEEYFKELHFFFYNNIEKGYIHLEPEVRTKQILFRRLTNFAHFYKIEPMVNATVLSENFKKEPNLDHLSPGF